MAISQGSLREVLQLSSIDHPEIEEFIEMKTYWWRSK